MSKKHQYLVSSRSGQTSVHKKERRKVAQNLSTLDGRKAKPVKPLKPTLPPNGTVRPTLMASVTRQPLESILTDALYSRSG